MSDLRIKKLATTLLEHSVRLKKGERVLLKGHPPAKPLLEELIDQVYALGAMPYVDMLVQELSRKLAMGYTKEQLETLAAWEMKKYQDVDAIVIAIAEDNDAEMADVPKDKFQLRGEMMKPVSDFYVNNRRWVLLNYPTPALAQKAKMSTDAFTDYLFTVCTADYKKMAEAEMPLKELMENTDRVHITGPNTDLSFSIKGIPAIPCAGEANIPDGEVFTAPVKESVNGRITFNTPCPYRGQTFHKVSLVFKDGKIAGSLHFTPGQAYEEADNGNRSAIHWDMVLIQRPEYGGGEIYFDDVLIRKDGRFVLPELAGLNPENLK